MNDQAGGGAFLLTEEHRVDLGPDREPGVIFPVTPGTARAARLGRRRALEGLARKKAAGLMPDRPPSYAELVRLWAEAEKRGLNNNSPSTDRHNAG